MREVADNQISQRSVYTCMIPDNVPETTMIDQFFDRLQMGRLLKQAGMTKQGGVRARQLLRFLLGLVFTQRNFYRLLQKPNPDTPKKDAVYRF